MAYKVDGLLGGPSDRMSPEEEQRLLMEIYGRPMPGGVGQQAAGPAGVPFGQQLIGGIPQQTSQFGPQTPTYQNFAPADAYASQFERSLAYQSALPSMIQPFNPANMPATYPQVAVDPYRLDIRDIELPDWLKAAIARGTTNSTTVAPDTSSASSRGNDIEH